MPDRQPGWEHPDGAECSVRALVEALTPFTKQLINEHVGIYASTDMTRGLDVAALEKNSKLLEALMRLDPRGGYHKQIRMAAAVKKLLSKDPETMAAFNHVMQAAGTLDIESIYAMLAYKLRVMLAHVRDKFDSSRTDPPDELRKVWSVMASSKQNTESTKRAKKNQRLAASRPHPFVAYQGEDDSEKEEEDDDDAHEPVAKYFDGSVAQMLMADGSMTVADTYEAGPQGFCVARWIAQQQTLQLEIANKYVENGKIILPAAPKAAPKAARKAARKAAPKDRSKKPVGAKKPVATVHGTASSSTTSPAEPMEIPIEVTDDEIAPAADQPTWTIRLRPGHHGNMTLTVHGKTKKDKAQLLSVSPDMVAKTKKDPSMVCKEVMEAIASQAQDLLSLPIKSCPELGNLRVIAQAERGKALLPEALGTL